MKTKTKLIVTIASLAMAAGMLVFATYAAFTGPYTFGGTITVTGAASATVVARGGTNTTVLGTVGQETGITFEPVNRGTESTWDFAVEITNTGSWSFVVRVIEWNTPEGFDVKVIYAFAPDWEFDGQANNGDNTSPYIAVEEGATVIFRIIIEVDTTVGNRPGMGDYEFEISFNLSDK